MGGCLPIELGSIIAWCKMRSRNGAPRVDVPLLVGSHPLYALLGHVSGRIQAVGQGGPVQTEGFYVLQQPWAYPALSVHVVTISREYATALST